MALCYNVTILSDRIIESDEMFVVVLSSSDRGVTILNGMSTVTIVDSKFPK